MSEPYLIAHIVRGEPAFDIAIKIECSICGGTETRQGEDDDYPCLECEEGHWWIIPTSGHRAYPYWSHKLWLGNAVIGTAIHWDEPDIGKGPFAVILPPPASWPDHYPTSAAPKGQGKITNLARRLGLLSQGTITRR